MSLFSYMQQTQRFLREQGQVFENVDDLTSYVNRARREIAYRTESLRVIGTVSTVIGQRPYAFSTINIGTSATTGLQGVVKVQNIQRVVAAGQKWINPRQWQWFQFFCLNNPVPQNGPPVTWAQFKSGDSPGTTTFGPGGIFYLDPPPDLVYTLNCDCVCYPNSLLKDTDVDAIAEPWTDAVPYFAAHLAMVELGNREAATTFLGLYEKMADMYTSAATNRWTSAQQNSQVQMSKLGLQRSGGS
jgi:hypothetical protein